MVVKKEKNNLNSEKIQIDVHKTDRLQLSFVHDTVFSSYLSFINPLCFTDSSFFQECLVFLLFTFEHLNQVEISQ